MIYTSSEENFNNYFYFPDTSIAVEKVLNGEKPGKSNLKSNNNKPGSDAAHNNRNSRNNKLNENNKKPRDSSRNSNTSGSNSRKNSLTGGGGSGPNSREPSKTRESKSPSKKIISRSNSKDDSVPVNGEINGGAGDSAQGLETVIEGTKFSKEVTVWSEGF